MNPLANRGLTRGSTVNQMTNEFNNNLINAEQNAMATEDQRVANIMNQLATYWQIPYNMMTGLQGNAQGLVGQQMQAQSASQQAQSGLLGGLAGGVGSIAGGALGNEELMKSILNAGATAGTVAVAASDRRLKENIELLQAIDGYNIYKFDYIKGAKNQVGVMAQEMLEKQLDCVGIGKDGYYFVDYAKLPEKIQRVIFKFDK